MRTDPLKEMMGLEIRGRRDAARSGRFGQSLYRVLVVLIGALRLFIELRKEHLVVVLGRGAEVEVPLNVARDVFRTDAIDLDLAAALALRRRCPV